MVQRYGTVELAHIRMELICARLPEGLPIRHAHERGVPEDLQAVLPFRRPFILCRLCVQRF